MDNLVCVPDSARIHQEQEKVTMEDTQDTVATNNPASSRESILLKILGDHYCGVYFVRTLDGFIHNLNSPLQVMWIRLDQIEQDMKKLRAGIRQTDEAQVCALVERIQERMRSLEKGFDELNNNLGFLTKDIISKQRSETGPVDINKTVLDTLFLLKADMFFKHRVKTSLKLDETLSELTGRYSDFCVIVLHLVQNALEAMVGSEERNLLIETLEERDDPVRIVLRVEDTGCGVSPEYGMRVFDPFVTTKDRLDYNGRMQEHAGLGLWVVSHLVQQYNGEVAYQSKPNKTSFAVSFPLNRSH
jgi:signal transduction histidine kinase